MAIRACFEIGHEAAIRAKRPSEVFTHDWEVFVRGVDNADISQFVEKVVFQLHDTFPKPKRVVKDPPYCVRESGYAGFTLPIEIHLKNRDDPKKIKFTYELTLQHSGPAIIRVQKEKFVFNNPSEEFRRKLLKGGAVIQPNNANHYLGHLTVEPERNSRDSFTDEKASQMMGKPKFGSDVAKKHKTKEYKPDDTPRASNSFKTLFGTPIHKTSTISPDPKKPSPNPKSDKKDKEKSHKDIDKQKLKYEAKEKEHREEKKIKENEKEKSKDDKKQKSHKERDSKDVILKREKPASPSPQAKRPYIPPIHSPPRGPSPNNKSNSSVSSKEESKIVKVDETRNKLNRSSESNPDKVEKKSKKEKKNHDKDRESKKEHKKEKEAKIQIHESRDTKPKEVPKETGSRESSKESKPPPPRPEKVVNKFSAENFLKEPVEKYLPPENPKHKDKTDRERKHKHKKKDKKRDESSDKNKDTGHKDKKHKHEKHKNKVLEVKNSPALSDKVEIVTIVREPEKKEIQTPKIFKEKERSQLTISPISLDTSSQSSSKSASKHSKSSKNPLGSLLEDLPSTSTSNSDISSSSDSEELSFGTDTSKKSAKVEPPPPPPKPILPEPKPQKQEVVQKTPKSKDKMKLESREEKKQRKRKTSTKGEEPEIVPKAPKIDEPDPIPKTKNLETFHKAKESSSRVKTEKVQDDGVSSSLTDALVKCDSPVNVIDNGVVECNEITPDYIMQLQELQQRIMTIQSSDELDRIVKLIANTGKYEVTKKTFDFDLCSLDRNTVQQLQELINCESRA